MSSLPEGWAVVELAEVAEHDLGKMLDRAKQKGDPLPYLRNINVRWGSFDLSDVLEMKFESDEIKRFELEAGDLVVCEGGEPGRCAIWPGSAATMMYQKALHRIRPGKFMDARWIRYQLQMDAFTGSLEQSFTGTTIKHFTGESLAKYKVLLTNLVEQKRIADKLDVLLARVDATRARLDRIPGLLKRFRQSVLAAATSGELTEEWRGASGGEFGQEVVKNDAARKAKMLDGIIELKKKKSSQNSQISKDHLFEIPNAWAFTSWGAVSEWITYGFTRPMPSTADGVKLLTAKDVFPFDIRMKQAGCTELGAFSALSEKDKPDPGDLLITKDGSIGRAALVREHGEFCINQSVAVCWLRSTTMNKDYLELVANTEFTQKFVTEKAKGMAIQHLSITDFAQCPIPVPSLKEQTEIVSRVETLFALADKVQSQYTAARARIDKLTASILAKAFRGELVPQDPNDEPASVLLERLRAKRDAAPAMARRRRKPAAKH